MPLNERRRAAKPAIIGDPQHLAAAASALRARSHDASEEEPTQDTDFAPAVIVERPAGQALTWSDWANAAGVRLYSPEGSDARQAYAAGIRPSHFTQQMVDARLQTHWEEGRVPGAEVEEESIPDSHDSVTEETEDAQAAPAAAVATVAVAAVLLPLNKVRPSDYNPRTSFPEEELAGLAASIKQNGVMQPILVRPLDGDQYEVVAGERRYRASLLAGKSDIPAVIRDLSRSEAILLALLENDQREELGPIDRANTLQRLRDSGMTVEEIAEKLGRKQSWVARSTGLLRLPADVQQTIREGKISEAHGARAQVFATASHEVASALIQIAVRDGWKVAMLEQPLPAAEELKARGLVERLDPMDLAIAPFADTCPKCPFKAFRREGDGGWCLKPSHYAELRAEAGRIAEARAKEAAANPAEDPAVLTVQKEVPTDASAATRADEATDNAENSLLDSGSSLSSGGDGGGSAAAGDSREDAELPVPVETGGTAEAEQEESAPEPVADANAAAAETESTESAAVPVPSPVAAPVPAAPTPPAVSSSLTRPATAPSVAAAAAVFSKATVSVLIRADQADALWERGYDYVEPAIDTFLAQPPLSPLALNTLKALVDQHNANNPAAETPMTLGKMLEDILVEAAQLSGIEIATLQENPHE